LLTIILPFASLLRLQNVLARKQVLRALAKDQHALPLAKLTSLLWRCGRRISEEDAFERFCYAMVLGCIY
jgi:hypothetical protein